MVAVGRSRTGSPCPLPGVIPLVSGSATLGAGLAWVAGAEPGCGHLGGQVPPPPPAATCARLHLLAEGRGLGAVRAGTAKSGHVLRDETPGLKSVYANKLISLMPGEDVEQRAGSEFQALARSYQSFPCTLWARAMHPPCGTFPPGLWTHNSLDLIS